MQKHQICKGKPKGEKIPAKQVCNLGNSSVKVPPSHVILSYTNLSSPSYTRRQWHYQEHSLGQWQMHQQETERLNVVKMFFHTDLLTDFFPKILAGPLEETDEMLPHFTNNYEGFKRHKNNFKEQIQKSLKEQISICNNQDDMELHKDNKDIDTRKCHKEFRYSPINMDLLFLIK